MENHDNIRPGEVQSPPENYLVWAILCTFLCCLPLGIFSIIKSTEVNKKWQQGDYAGAQQSSADAKKYATWGAIAGVVVNVIVIILYFTIFAAAMASNASGYSGY